MSGPLEPPALHTKLSRDLKVLETDYGMSRELITSLTTSKRQAKAHIAFFKRMMFISNAAVMTLGLAIAGFGGRTLMSGFSVIGVILLLCGGLLFLKFTTVFMSMARGIRAAEATAQKHGLI